MLKKTITYTDFNGDEVSDDCFFHLSKAELVELELSHEGGLSESLQRIVDAEDGKAIIAEFKGIILGAYGKRSPDGKRFIKNQELRDEFESSEAYSTLFMELVTDADVAVEFINGVIPANLAEEAAKLAKNQTAPALIPVPESQPAEELPAEELPGGGRVTEIISKKDVEEMSQEELNILGTRLAKGEVKLGE